MRVHPLFPGTWLRVFLLIIQALFVMQGWAATATIDWANVRQRIDGFGASCAFDTFKSADLNIHFQPAIDDPGTQVSVSDFIFDPQKGLGISVLRSDLKPTEPDPADFSALTQFDVMRKAREYGVQVWSTPWTPPASLKNNGTVGGGGYLLSRNYDAYAQRLAKYVRDLHAKGVDLYAISIQNEPNLAADYASCIWSAQDFHDFIPFLYRALQANRTPATPTMPIPKIMLPENGQWRFELASTTIQDPATLDMVGILAGHNYGPNRLGDIAPVATNGKALWETETCSKKAAVVDAYANGIEWAERVHAFMVKAEANAFHYWWINAPATTNSHGLLTDWEVRPLAYTIGQFSRFIRPGYYRIASNNASGLALISAYRDPASNKFAVVAINSTSSAITQTFSFANSPALSGVTPWMTTSAMNMKQQVLVPMGAGNSFTYTLPARSVVTFVGSGRANSNAAPTVSLGSSVTINSPLVNPTNIVWHFSGEIADDGLPSGGSVTKAWTKMSGPAVTFTTPKAPDTDVTFSTAGDYVLRLTANDGALSSFADLSVRVVGKSADAAPTVNAGADFAAVAGDVVVLKGMITDSDRPASSAFGQEWIQVSGPGDEGNPRLFISSRNSPESQVRFQMAGTYVLRLTYERPVTGGQGTISISDDVEVKVTQNGPRLPPFVYPGNPTTNLFLPTNFLQLYGVIIYDGTTSPRWSKVSGPGTVSFSDANVITSQATFSAVGTYVLRLTGTPSDGSQPGFAERTISLTSATRSLAVYAGANQSIAVTASAILNGNVTEVGLPAGASVRAQWSKISGSGSVTFAQSANVDTTAIFSVGGVYVLRLTVNDGTFVMYDDTTVTVTGTIPPSNVAPTVATAAKATPSPVTTTTLSVLGADDAGEAALKYHWDTSGTPPAAVTFSANDTNAAKSTVATFTQTGTYAFVVTITDAGGLTVTSAVTVVVNQTLTTAAVTPATATVVAGATRTFTAAGKDQFADAMSTAPTWTWTVAGGGTISAAGAFTAGSTASGSYTITATSGRISATATVTITAPNQRPVATPQVVTTAEDTAVTITLAGTDSDGTIATYTYQQPAHGVVSRSGAQVTYTPSANFNGPDSFTFTVTDNLGALSASATVSMTVTSVNDLPVVASTIGPKTASVGTLYSYTFPAFTDADGDALTYSASGLPAGLTQLGRRISGTPTVVGANPVTITADDLHGGTATTSFTLTVTTVPDTTGPATPAAPTLTRDGTTTPAISGTTEPNATISIRVDGVEIDTVVADGSGAWSYMFSSPPAGTHQITVVAIDTSNNPSAVSPAVTVTVPGGSTGGGGGGTSAGGGGGGGCGLGSGAIGLLTLGAWAFLGFRRRGSASAA